jgi:hypothetical protein
MGSKVKSVFILRMSLELIIDAASSRFLSTGLIEINLTVMEQWQIFYLLPVHSLALSGAAGAAGKALEKARSMFNATNELSSLIDEVSNIQLIMLGLLEENRLRKPNIIPQGPLTEALSTLL